MRFHLIFTLINWLVASSTWLAVHKYATGDVDQELLLYLCGAALCLTMQGSVHCLLMLRLMVPLNSTPSTRSAR